MTPTAARKMDPHGLLGMEDIQSRLEEIPDWTLHGKEIQRQFEFDDFRQAMEFVNEVADAANKADHHPEILINYNKVTLTLSTHSAGGLTSKDFDLAKDVDFI